MTTDMSIGGDESILARPKVRRMPGEEGVWVLIIGDLLVFSLFFILFLYYRSQAVEVFRESQGHLNQTLALLNTILLLTSSWFVASAVRAARMNLGRVTPVLLLCGLACGAAFGAVKFVEYEEKIGSGISLTTNDFYMYYFVFTGIHMFHVIVGVGVLAFLACHTWDGASEPEKIQNLESGASFWHLIDLLWIMLFALIYLMR